MLYFNFPVLTLAGEIWVDTGRNVYNQLGCHKEGASFFKSLSSSVFGKSSKYLTTANLEGDYDQQGIIVYFQIIFFFTAFSLLFNFNDYFCTRPLFMCYFSGFARILCLCLGGQFIVAPSGDLLYAYQEKNAGEFDHFPAIIKALDEFNKEKK
jgi:hypothetical protein